MNNSQTRQKLLFFSLVAILSSLTFAMTFINIRLPIPGNGGLVHFGNIPVVIASILLGKKYGALVGAIGMTLFDLIGGWFLWAPFTFVIRFAVGFVIGLVAEKRNGESFVYNVIGILLGGVILIGGYYIAEWIIYGNALIPIASIPGNAIQIASMIVLGLPLATTLKKTLPKAL